MKYFLVTLKCSREYVRRGRRLQKKNETLKNTVGRPAIWAEDGKTLMEALAVG